MIKEFKFEAVRTLTSPVDKEKDYIFQVANYTTQKDDEIEIQSLDLSTENASSINTSETISEVTMQYNLQIKKSNILPLEFELYNYDENTNKAVGENLLTNSISNNATIGFGEKQTQTYILKIKWKDGKDNYLYSKEIDCLQLVLNSEQVD